MRKLERAQPDCRRIVLKFGGSVLRDEGTLRGAVHEIHRWRREGYRVIAVVSALAGTTDQLLQRCHHVDAGSAGHAVAAVVAGGELSCASLLGLLLERAGVPARVLAPSALELVAEGPPLDATPVSANLDPIARAHGRDEVVVVPGFAACDDQGRTVLLGRGGSDLTALFLACGTEAERCRLIKDVDGLYEHDPSAPERPARYSVATWEDALHTDGSIVQHKAVRFAREHGLRFELGRLNGTRPTLIGEGASIKQEDGRDLPRRLRVALLGFGTVGAGIYELLAGLPDLFEVSGIAVRDVQAHRRACGRPELLTSDPESLVEDAEVVVEAMGGRAPAESLVRAALRAGRHVVTANKSLVAACGAEFTALAKQAGSSFLYSASVGGSMPLLERLVRSRAGVTQVRGVLNGTVNFVLDGLAEGGEWEAVLGEAHLRGFAESEATRDLSGLDAAEKLVVIAGSLGVALSTDEVERASLDAGWAERARAARRAGETLRQVSTLTLDEGGAQARVALERLGPGDAFFGVHGERNAAWVGRVASEPERVDGKGAGRWPTAESAMGDLLEIARRAQASEREVRDREGRGEARVR